MKEPLYRKAIAMCKHHKTACRHKRNDTTDTIRTIVTLPFVALVAIPLLVLDQFN